MSQLNQFLHAHLRWNGRTCRFIASADNLEDKFDSLCSKFAPELPDMPEVKFRLTKDR